MKHAKTSVSTEIFAGAIISVVQYLALLRYAPLRAADAFDAGAVEQDNDRPRAACTVTDPAHRHALRHCQTAVVACGSWSLGWEQCPPLCQQLHFSMLIPA
jgi:hypothetical protein